MRLWKGQLSAMRRRGAWDEWVSLVLGLRSGGMLRAAASVLVVCAAVAAGMTRCAA